ncbi:MAG: hypothetical protein GKS04_01330 [Candidatus Mycalebacterium zealandia]|nr:MAG: hypothetical protein GKS04_01330 [Candidatus Mycalebacterium zealandia]
MSAQTDLDALVDGAGKERVEAAMKIARREWGKIGSSLRMCGETGDFDRNEFMIGVIDEDVIIKSPLSCATKSVDVNSPTYYPMYFVKNLIEMDELMPERGYRTPQALYCHIELAAKAAEALGLTGTIAMGFACGYAVARTGWTAEKGLRRKRQFFLETFFEGWEKNHDWNPEWDSVGNRLKKIFDKFCQWQKDGELHERETAEDRKIKPLLV